MNQPEISGLPLRPESKNNNNLQPRPSSTPVRRTSRITASNYRPLSNNNNNNNSNERATASKGDSSDENSDAELSRKTNTTSTKRHAREISQETEKHSMKNTIDNIGVSSRKKHRGKHLVSDQAEEIQKTLEETLETAHALKSLTKQLEDKLQKIILSCETLKTFVQDFPDEMPSTTSKLASGPTLQSLLEQESCTKQHWDRFCNAFGLKQEDWKEICNYKGKKYEVIGIKPNKPKSPILLQSMEANQTFVWVDAQEVKELLKQDPCDLM